MDIVKKKNTFILAYIEKLNLDNDYYIVIVYMAQMFFIYFKMSLVRNIVCRRPGEWQLELY